MICPHAASGCNYPEGECDGLCMNKGENKVDEQDKAAFYDAWQGEHSGEEDAQRRAMFWFNKGLEYARSQQEPVAWRHNLTHCLYETEEEVPLADGEEWADPLYTTPPAQPVQPAAAINEQLLRALKVAQGILFEAGYDIDDGGEHFSEYVQITDAIAAAEAAKGAA